MITLFFGDQERAFSFDTLGQMGALETACNASFYTVYSRLAATTLYDAAAPGVPSQQPFAADIFNVLHQGLMNAGTDPVEASRVMKMHFEGKPLEGKNGPRDVAFSVMHVRLYGMNKAFERIVGEDAIRDADEETAAQEAAGKKSEGETA